MSRHTISARLLIFAASLLFSGCESLSDAAGSVRDRIAAREETRERTYAAAPRATYDALKSAATQMGYRQTRGGPAQGEFDAVSAVAPGERHGSARQILMKARVTAGLDGKSAVVGVSLTESQSAFSVIQPDNEVVTLLRAEVIKETAMPASAMPPFDRAMSAADLAALVAWLIKT